jgi:hypothetical protein
VFSALGFMENLWFWGLVKFFHLLELFCGQNLQISSKLPIFVLALLNLKMSYQRPLISSTSSLQFFSEIEDCWMSHLNNKGLCHTVALPFILKSILRQKKNYGNSNIFHHAKI